MHLESIAGADDSKAGIARVLSRAVDNLSCDRRLVRPDGSAVWVEMRVRSLQDAEGTVCGLLVQAMDITGRRAAESAAVAGQRRLEEAQRLAGMSSFELDPVTGLIRYQPIVDSRTGSPTGAEALVRWRHPERGLLTPAVFIGLAESTGLIVQLGSGFSTTRVRRPRRGAATTSRTTGSR